MATGQSSRVTIGHRWWGMAGGLVARIESLIRMGCLVLVAGSPSLVLAIEFQPCGLMLSLSILS